MQVQTEKNKITFSCPKCTATLKVPMQLAGVSGPCPKCGGTIVAPRPPIQSQPEPPTQVIPEIKVSPLPVTPRISVTHGSTNTSTVNPAVAAPPADVATREKPPRVEIEDLNPPAAPTPKPAPAEKAAFPQSFQSAITDDELDPAMDSFDEINPQPEPAPQPQPEVATAPQPVAVSAPLQEKTEKLAPLPIVANSFETPAPTPKEEPTVLAEVPAPAPKPEPSAEEPRVTVTTLPAAQVSPASIPAVTPKPAQISVETTVQKPAAIQPATAPVVSPPRIQRGARNAAKTAAARSAATESTETRPISPVTKTSFMEQQASPSPAAPQASPQPSIPSQSSAASALPRLDVSLATKAETGPTPVAPKPVSKKPTGPTKINLPQLNNGQAGVTQSTSAPAVEPILMPTKGPEPKATEHQEIPLTQAPPAVPDPTAVPVMRRKVQAAPVQQLAPGPLQAQSVEQSGLPPMHDEVPQPQQVDSSSSTQSLQEQLTEAIAPEQAPRQAHSPAMEQPPQAQPNTVRKLFPQRRQPVQEDRGLENVIFEDSTKAQLASPETDNAFDDLFGAPEANNERKRKFGMFHAGIIGTVVVLAGVAIILVGYAFGVFDLDDKTTTAEGTNSPPAVDTDKPAVERPPEKEAIPIPTDPVNEIATTGVLSDTGSAPNPDSATATTTGIVTGSATTPSPDTAQPAIPGKDFNSLKISDGTGSSAASAAAASPAPESSDTVILGSPPETPATIVNSDDNVPDTIRETIEAASKAIETNPSAVEMTNAINALAPATEKTLNGVFEAAGNAIPTIPNPNTVAATSDGTTEIQPRPFSAGGQTGEFRQPPASAVAGPPAPAPNTFTPPSSAGGSKLGKSRQLVETFLEAPTWEGLIPYTYRSNEIKGAMARYYTNWPYQPLGRTALKFEQMESDPDYGGPFWIYNVTTSEDAVEFPIVVRQEKDLLKVDWGIYAEFRDQLFVKFNNGEIAGQKKFKLIIEHLSTYYGTDAEVFTNLKDYYVFRLAPPYGSKDLEEVAFVAKTSPIGTKLNELVPLNSSPLAVTVELENQSFPHGVNHLVITRVVTDGWFE